MQENSGKKVLIECKAGAEPGRTGREAVNQIGRGKEPQSDLPKAVKQAGSANLIATFLATHCSVQSLHSLPQVVRRPDLCCPLADR